MSLLLLTLLATNADAQQQTFTFQGTLVSTTGTPTNTAQFGATVSGEVTLNYAATPDTLDVLTGPARVGQYAIYIDGGFSLDVVTSGGFTGGTSTDGGTIVSTNDDFAVYDNPQGSYHYADVNTEGLGRGVVIRSSVAGEATDGIADFADWTPLDDDNRFVYIYIRNASAPGLLASATYTIDSFAPVVVAPNTIIVNGIDTGIEDFEYGSMTITEWMESIELVMPPRLYVPAVRLFTLQLWLQGKITFQQMRTIVAAAKQGS
ncbi:MAG: hypothetical protein R3B90_08825 [Planctomycetaceae bacterium]